MTIDAYQHFQRISRGDYAWMDQGAAPIAHDLLPADLAPLDGAGGVEGTVVVPAAPTVEETLFPVSLAAEREMLVAATATRFYKL